MTENQYTISGPSDDSTEQPCPCLCEYHNFTSPTVELIGLPEGRRHKPLRNWKKSQKKIRRERRQRGKK